ncbi:TIGR02444 family protein [Variovorax sp. DT-64]|uniref:TIGR02444 family protein n=1 Tax=Variovorax sp. DT-64 TaxID=3396160 RepID=UPI003F1A7193
MTHTASDAFSLEWNYALEVYAKPGVAEACLLLQDRAGVDVVVLLHAIYLFATKGIALDEQALASAEARVGSWRREVTAPLRALRTTLKPGFAGMPPEFVAQTRQKIKEAELDAEFAAFAAVCGDIEAHRGDPVPVPGNARPLLDRVLRLYAADAPPASRHDAAVQTAVHRMRRLLDEERARAATLMRSGA